MHITVCDHLSSGNNFLRNFVTLECHILLCLKFVVLFATDESSAYNKGQFGIHLIKVTQILIILQSFYRIFYLICYVKGILCLF